MCCKLYLLTIISYSKNRKDLISDCKLKKIRLAKNCFKDKFNVTQKSSCFDIIQT